MSINEHIARSITKLRVNYNSGKGISQSELANRLGEKPNTISRWETGSYKPKPEDLEKLSHFFNVSILTFFPNEEITKEDELTAFFRGNKNLSEEDYEEIKRFAEFRIAAKNLIPKKSSGRKRKNSD